MIAMALVNDPELLIADEPTTALDVTVQAQILDLISDLQKEFGSAVIIITHDLGVVAEIADDVLVMYGGRCVEHGTAEEVFDAARAPVHLGPARLDAAPRRRADRPAAARSRATRPSLINLPRGCAFHPRCTYAELQRRRRAAPSVPELLRGRRRGTGSPATCPQARPPADLDRRDRAEAVSDAMTETLRSPTRRRSRARRRADEPASRCSRSTGLQKHFPITRGPASSGRSARCRPSTASTSTVTRRRDARPGRRVRLRQVDHRPADHPAAGADRRQDRRSRAGTSRTCRRAGMRPLRRDMQMIFQDPYSSLNPRHTVGTIVGAPLQVQGIKPEGGVKKRGPGAAGARRPQPRALQPLPARVLRRPAPAHRHRPGARPAARS